MKITFLGAAGEVTGSCHLVEAENLRFLVDCGMFQGGPHERNWRPFGFDPKKLDFVLLTHAHIDHSGLLPRLVSEGFSGKIHTTSATFDLLEVMLPDSAHIQEKEAEWAQKHDPQAKPLYTVEEARESLKQVVSEEYDLPFQPHPGVKVVLREAGHILGSAIIELWVEGKKLVFSGDIGQPGFHVVRKPAAVARADYLLVESTYGDRLHRNLSETIEELVHAIGDTLVRKRGNVIIPAFTVGRSQDILFLLTELYREGRLPKMNIYVDSPMAYSATAITLKHRELLGRKAEETLEWMNSHRMSIRFVQDVQESIAINEIREGAVIISASGMCDAGRVKHHLKLNLPRPECTVLITGFQAAGTLGRRLVDGAREVRIFGQDVQVRADIYTIGGLSAHADQSGILSWLSNFDPPPQKTFIVHGEPSSSAALSEKIAQWPDWVTEIPSRGDCFEP